MPLTEAHRRAGDERGADGEAVGEVVHEVGDQVQVGGYSNPHHLLKAPSRVTSISSESSYLSWLTADQRTLIGLLLAFVLLLLRVAFAQRLAPVRLLLLAVRAGLKYWLLRGSDSKS